jgi:uncharacterized protein (UPF0210 family)
MTIPEADTWRAYIVDHPDEVDVRALTQTINCDEQLEFHPNPARAIRPEARRAFRRLIDAVVSAEVQSGLGVRSLRLAVRGGGDFIHKLVRRGMRPDAAAAWLGRALQLGAADATGIFQREHLRRTPKARAWLLRRRGADRVRDVYTLVELPGGDDDLAVRTLRLIEPVLSGNTRVFVGFTASTEGKPASALTLEAAAHEVHLLGSDAARLGINFHPPENGAFFPGTRPARSGMLSAGVADAELLANAIRRARSAGKSDAEIEEALIAAHATMLRMAAEVAQRVAARRGLRWDGISPVSAPVNCTIHGAPPQWRSSWAVLEELHGAPVESINILQATARYNACLYRAAKLSQQKVNGFIGSFNPPAEDGLLAQRVREGRITVRDLILQESVCSAGIDMCVVRPETTAAQIAALYGEVASLSDQWSKPLTVRLIVPPRTAPRTAEGDLILGGLLGAGPAMALPSSSGSAAHRVQTVGRLQRRLR